MREIAPGLFHWTAFHEGIRSEVSSYFLRDSGVLIDPLLPGGGFDGGTGPLEWLRQNGPPKAILLTNRHHYRHSGQIAEAFDVTEGRASQLRGSALEQMRDQIGDSFVDAA